MATMTRLELGPRDHGRPIAREDFEAATGRPGYRFEIIGGRVYVSPTADQPHEFLENWLFGELFTYSHLHPEAINYVSFRARVFVPDRPETTCPEPDVAAYRGFPHHLSAAERNWEDLSPLLVAEVVSESDPAKDLERNVQLYLEVPSIREYWVLDPRPDPDRPTLRVYRRRGRRWQKPIEVPAGATYETPKLLPGLALVIEPRRQG